MKKSKILVPALALVAFSTAAAVTGTVAWFSANKEVGMAGVDISAKSDAVDLQIALAADGEWKRNVTSAVDVDLLPVAHETFGSTVTDPMDASSGDVWYYGYSKEIDDATLDDDTKTYLTSLNGYVASEEYFFRLAADNGTTGENLKVSSLTVGSEAGLKIIAVGTDGWEEFDENSTAGTKSLIDEIQYVEDGEDSTYKVTLYFYINGDDDNITTENLEAGSLTGSISIKFSID